MTFHTAARVKRQRWYRGTDLWKVVAAFTALILVLLLAYGAWRNYELREAEAAQKDDLIAELTERTEQIEALEARLMEINDRANEERRDARAERRRLLRQQDRMLRILQGLGVDTSQYEGVVVLTEEGPQEVTGREKARPHRSGGGGNAPRSRPSEDVNEPSTPSRPNEPAPSPSEPDRPVRDTVDGILDLPCRLLNC